MKKVFIFKLNKRFEDDEIKSSSCRQNRPTVHQTAESEINGRG